MNRKLSLVEKEWFNLLLSPAFTDRDILRLQLSQAYVYEERHSPYISLLLKTDSNTPFHNTERVPIIMTASLKNGQMVDFLLHIVGGFVQELEIYDVAGGMIDYDSIDICSVTYEIRI